jgi:sulfhydrogenase subunit beta (sulfur reductase)
VGPRVREGSVVYDEVRAVADLPVGRRDEQAPGRYRLREAGDERVFGVVHGPGGIKPFVFAPRETLLEVEGEGPGRTFQARPTLPEPRPTALLGVRACDLAGLRVQDRVFLHDHFPDPYYASRRRDLLLVAVSCTRSVSTCFCTSMGTGPEVSEGHDLALTELDGGFLVRAGSPAGAQLRDALDTTPAPAERLLEERRALDACARDMARHMRTDDMPDLLYDNLDHPRWDDVAERCLSCGNCTLVCPTCFCHDERDEPWLDGGGSVRVREWDSCFDREHAQVHGMNFRPRTRHRYRQWLVHKVASWIDKFGTSGCVGCGRCITWCPVGIDLTEEVAAIRGDATGGHGERS